MFGLIFGIACAICGLVAIVVGRNMSEKDRAIAGWPRAPGTITTSQIENVLTSMPTRDYNDRMVKISVPTPIIKFSYTADGRELQGDKISRYAHAFTKDPLNRYPLGAAVQVYYDPKEPTTAYLEAPRSPAAKIFGIMGWAFVLLGIVAPLVERAL